MSEHLCGIGKCNLPILKIFNGLYSSNRSACSGPNRFSFGSDKTAGSVAARVRVIRRRFDGQPRNYHFDLDKVKHCCRDMSKIRLISLYNGQTR